MGNKIKGEKIEENHEKINNYVIKEKTEFFEDTVYLNKDKKKQINPTDIEHNPLISQFKSDPFIYYSIIKTLGEGTYAKVYLVKQKSTEAIRAMKEIQRNQEEDVEDLIINEINILMKLDHPNIVKIFEFYVSKSTYYLITEYCSEGSLYDFINNNKGPFTEIQTSYIMHQLFSAVNYCHKMKVIHRDIKPENILINKNDNGFATIKLCDFGTSLRFNRGDIQNEIVGSIYYIAPEVLKKKYDNKCDLWSCGVIMYILLTGCPPFAGKDNQTIMKKILSGFYDTTRLKKRCKACVDLISKLLVIDINARIRADAALNHKWFKIYKSKEIKNDIDDPAIIEKFINNLKNYQKSDNNIIEYALAYLIHNHPELEEVDLACKIFARIDKKGNGKITKEELYEGLSSFYQSYTLKEDVNKIFGNKKYIDYEEFIRAGIDKKIFLTMDSLKFAFNYFDKNGHGEITPDDISSIFSEGNLSKKEIEKAKKMIKEANKSKSEIIKFPDFCEIMKSFLE